MFILYDFILHSFSSLESVLVISQNFQLIFFIPYHVQEMFSKLDSGYNFAIDNKDVVLIITPQYTLHTVILFINFQCI